MVRSPRSFAILVFCVLAAVLIAGGSVYSVERVNHARESEALSSAKMLGLAAFQYAQDHKGRYPDAGRWEQEVSPYFEPVTWDILRLRGRTLLFAPAGLETGDQAAPAGAVSGFRGFRGPGGEADQEGARRTRRAR